jgi:hypothetical protein
VVRVGTLGAKRIHALAWRRAGQRESKVAQ